jgi:hypothetical protein
VHLILLVRQATHLDRLLDMRIRRDSGDGDVAARGGSGVGAGERDKEVRVSWAAYALDVRFDLRGRPGRGSAMVLASGSYEREKIYW